MKKFCASLILYLLLPLLVSACSDEKPVVVLPTDSATVAKTATLARATPTGVPTTIATTTAISASTLSPTDLSNINSGSLVLLELDTSRPGEEISPYIYGLAGSDDKDPNYVSRINPGLMRWGGNPSTRYNWVLGNAWNAGRNYEFRNGDYGNGKIDVASLSIESSIKQKIPFLLTIPTIGWVAKNSNINTRSLNVPPNGGPPVSPGADAIPGYDPTANRNLTSVRSEARKNAPFVVKPDPQSTVIYQDEWVASLVSRYGPASAGGVKFYAMDNEPELWSSTHTDVHPAQMGYDDILNKFTEYASAVKDVDPGSMITGPVTWGWTNYLWSALDQGTDNYRTAADRAKHGGTAFLPWFLDQLSQYEKKNGKRLLDVLDIHYYPQSNGVFADSASKVYTDPYTNALRLRSTRSLGNTSYVDESWINTPIRLVPRMKDWIAQFYPGTKLGISEWNFGADDTLNGALAIAQVLGTFGREGVYMAAYWRYPPAESPGFYAFKLFTNFDDNGTRFGGKVVPLKNSNENKINAYAALDSSTGKLRLILINTQPDNAQNTLITLSGLLSKQSANMYQLSADTGNKLVALKPLEITETTSKVNLALPAYSATLIEFQAPGN